jgi:hypothetical protein
MSGFFGGGGGGGGGSVDNPMTADLDADYNDIINPTLKGYAEALYTNAAVTGTLDLDCSAYNVFDLTLTGDVALRFINPPASGLFSCTVILTMDGNNNTPSFDGNNSANADGSVIWPNNSAPTIAEVDNARHTLSFWTKDGSGLWHGALGPSSYVAP